MPVLTVPAPLRERLGSEATDSLVVFINAANDSVRDDVIEIVGERFERRLSEEIRASEARLDRRITEEVAGLRVDMAGLRVEMADMRTTLDQRITEEAARLRVEMASIRADLIRWMFAFWIGQIAVLAALLTLLR